MLNIVIPMAGRGSRFANAGYKLPKPLIDVNGKPMIEVVVNNLRPKCEHRFIFLCLEEHIKQYDLELRLGEISPDSIIVPVSQVTEGAACTVLLAEKYINNDDRLMIANSDQYIDVNINDYLAAENGSDGLIMTMTANDPKWSFIKYDENKFVTEVREKVVISDEATVGIYNFVKGSDFVLGAHNMIDKNIRVNNEFYVAPVYNQLIEDGKKFKFYNIGSERDGMYGLGIPEDLEWFLNNFTFAGGGVTADFSKQNSLYSFGRPKVAVICPIHPPKFDQLKICLDSFYKYNLNLFADFWLVFSNEHDMYAYDGHERFLVVPPEIRLDTNAVVNRKKLYAINEISKRGYEYLITIDSDFIFADTVDLKFICDRYFEEKTIIANHVSCSTFIRINQCCISHFRNNIDCFDIPTDLYTWLNQPCIYRSDTISDFFDCMDFGYNLNMYFWDDFDYILYSYYLIIYHQFKICEMIGWNNSAFGESKSIPNGFDFETVKNLHFLTVALKMEKDFRLIKPDNELFLIVHTDRI